MGIAGTCADAVVLVVLLYARRHFGSHVNTLITNQSAMHGSCRMHRSHYRLWPDSDSPVLSWIPAEVPRVFRLRKEHYVFSVPQQTVGILLLERRKDRSGLDQSSTFVGVLQKQCTEVNLFPFIV